MSILSLEDIKKTTDIKTETIYIPEWNGEVTIRGITAEEFDKIQKDSFVENPVTRQMEYDELRNQLLMIVNGVVLPELQMKDCLWLKNKSYVALRRILFGIQDLSSGRQLGANNARPESSEEDNKEPEKS